jgi:hypothetical protein
MAMQACGWQLGVETHVPYDRAGYVIRLAGKHPGMDLKCISYPFEMDRGLRLDTRTMSYAMSFDLHVCAREVVMSVQEAPRFNQVDFSKPYFEPLEKLDIGKHVSLEECLFFRPLNDQTDIYIPEKKIWTVMEHLQQIKELQNDKQKEIREKMRKKRRREGSINNSPNEYDPRREVKLQLIAI